MTHGGQLTWPMGRIALALILTGAVAVIGGAIYLDATDFTPYCSLTREPTCEPPSRAPAIAGIVLGGALILVSLPLLLRWWRSRPERPVSRLKTSAPKAPTRIPVYDEAEWHVADEARSTLSRLLALGLILIIVGGVIVGANWPTTSELYDPFSDSTSTRQDGDWSGVGLGLFLGAIGQLLLFPALVGYGVQLGRQASPPPRSLQ